LLLIIAPGEVFALNVRGFTIRSYEHASTISKFFPETKTAAANSPASAGIKSMADQTPDRLRQILERIRQDAEQALSLLKESAEHRALSWKCKNCEYVKHFTKPVTLDVLGRCPRCKSDQFVPT
jgi:predicted Zn-ribbon and HTH transcriptional regulator